MGGAPQVWWQQDWLWAAVAAIVQILLLVSVPTSIWLYRKEERSKFYVQLDDMYLRILQMVVENPELRNAASNGAKYDAFALTLWNFLETIYDYCSRNKKLMETWGPILRTESAAHAEWFDRPENRLKFKPKFCEYVDRRGWDDAPETLLARLSRVFR